MAARQTGFALLASGSVREAHDLAAIAYASTLEARIPFLHFFDGFRTSHELNNLFMLSDDELRAMTDGQAVRRHRERALRPDRPVLRGTAQNPDVFFQAREACNAFYLACPAIVQGVMDSFASQTGRGYHLFDYFGAPDAERVMIVMGSAVGPAEETVERLNAHGEKVGLLKVRLFRPFAVQAFMNALPVPLAPLPSWIAPRSREALASRFIWTLSPPLPKQGATSVSSQRGPHDSVYRLALPGRAQAMETRAHSRNVSTKFLYSTS